jgi:hypothetical protein
MRLLLALPAALEELALNQLINTVIHLSVIGRSSVQRVRWRVNEWLARIGLAEH